MAFDFKKEYKEFYLPKLKPEIVTVPPMKYVAVSGRGDPNEADGEYKKAIGVLYAIAYTIKMSKMGDRRIDGYFDFVVPLLEGFWWQDDEYIKANGYENDFSETRRHHEIYLTDARRVAPERWKTVIRHPIRKGR